MNFKRVAIKTEEVEIKRITQTVEIDFDFTQVYDCMYALSFHLKSPISFQLLFYMLRTMKDDNDVVVGNKMYKEFISEMKAHANREISEVAFYNCIKELVKAKIMTRTGRGRYFVNPYVLWKNDKASRVEFLKADAANINNLTFNPIKRLEHLGEADITREKK